MIPLVTHRDRVPYRLIKNTVAQIVRQYQPLKVVLFGSYAYGNPRPESDVDLLVIMETSLKETEQAIQICQAIDYHFGLDLIVHTPETLSKRIELGDPFMREIVDKGKVLYERSYSRMGG